MIKFKFSFLFWDVGEGGGWNNSINNLVLTERYRGFAVKRQCFQDVIYLKRSFLIANVKIVEIIIVIYSFFEVILKYQSNLLEIESNQWDWTSK